MKITITATGEYPYSEALAPPGGTARSEALATGIEACMKAYGFRDIEVDILHCTPTCNANLIPGMPHNCALGWARRRKEDRI